jgi:hypothetical protein
MVYPCRGVYCRGNIIDSDASVIISQSFLSGRPFSCKYDRKRGLKTRANHVMFIITNFMYLLSAAYWGYSVADLVDRMRVDIRDPQDSDSPMHDTVTKWSPLFNAVVLVNVRPSTFIFHSSDLSLSISSATRSWSGERGSSPSETTGNICVSRFSFWFLLLVRTLLPLHIQILI